MEQIIITKTCPGETVLTSTHNLRFEQKYEKYQNFLSNRNANRTEKHKNEITQGKT